MFYLITGINLDHLSALVTNDHTASGGANEFGDDIIEFDDETGAVVSKPQRKPRLIGLRVEQTLANGTTPVRTVFGMRQHLGCWWVRL